MATRLGIRANAGLDAQAPFPPRIFRKIGNGHAGGNNMRTDGIELLVLETGAIADQRAVGLYLEPREDRRSGRTDRGTDPGAVHAQVAHTACAIDVLRIKAGLWIRPIAQGRVR
jgi:hypothetical protein